MRGLGTILIDTLRSARTDRPYALVDYPNYLNPGDAAIWLGARKALETLNGGPPGYSASLREFSSAACHAAIGTGTIYFLGGGNFGDLYPKHHRARLQVIQSAPGSPIVLLPSSCALSDAVSPQILAETRRIMARTAGVFCFARERNSQRQLLELFGIESVLCPDLVHALDISGPPPSKDVTALLRKDREAASPPHAQAADWSDWRGQRFWNRSGKLMLRFAPGRARARIQDWVAWKKTQGAIDAVAHGRALVTDRLHAMLLGAAVGRDVVVLDNRTGKVMAYQEQWREHLPRVHTAATLDAAWRAAADLAASR